VKKSQILLVLVAMVATIVVMGCGAPSDVSNSKPEDVGNAAAPAAAPGASAPAAAPGQ